MRRLVTVLPILFLFACSEPEAASCGDLLVEIEADCQGEAEQWWADRAALDDCRDLEGWDEEVCTEEESADEISWRALELCAGFVYVDGETPDPQTEEEMAAHAYLQCAQSDYSRGPDNPSEDCIETEAACG